MKITHQYIWAIVWPLVIASLSVPLMNLTDAFMLGQLQSPVPLASLVIGTKIFEFSLFLLYFLSLGTTTLVSRSLSKNDEHAARLWGMRSLLLSLILGILMVPILWSIGPTWITFLGATAQTHDQALLYLHICLISVPAQIATQAINGWLFGSFQSKRVMTMTLTSNGVNIVLTILLVQWFDLGIAGAALGTVVAQWFAFVYGLIAARDLLQNLRPHFAQIIEINALRELFSANRDLLIRSICVLSFLQCLTKMSAEMGTIGIAAMGILLMFLMTSSYVQEAMVRATEMLVARYYDQDNLTTYHQVVKKLSLWFLGAIVILGSVFLFGGETLVLAITKDKPTQDVAISLLPYVIAYIGITSWNYFYNAVLIGLGAFAHLRNAYIISFGALLLAMWLHFYPAPDFDRLWQVTLFFEVVRFTCLKLSIRFKLQPPSGFPLQTS